MRKAIAICLILGSALLTACEEPNGQPEPTDVLFEETETTPEMIVTEVAEMTYTFPDNELTGNGDFETGEILTYQLLEETTASEEEAADIRLPVRIRGKNTGYIYEEFLMWGRGMPFIVDTAPKEDLPENADCILYLDANAYYTANESYFIIRGENIKGFEVTRDYSKDFEEKIGED